MTRTEILRTAYHVIMEILLAILILSLSGKDADFKETLRTALDFYRENRELLKTLVGSSSALSQPRPANRETPQTEKNSPVSGGDDLSVLEEFLKKYGV